MNKKRKKTNFSLSELILLALAATILTVGGLMHVYAKNEEVKMARKIDAAKKEIEQYEEHVLMVNVKIDRRLDRYQLKEDLLAQGSTLRETDPSQFVYVEPEKDGMIEASAQ